MIAAAEEARTFEARSSKLSDRRWRSFTTKRLVDCNWPASGRSCGGREGTDVTRDDGEGGELLRASLGRCALLRSNYSGAKKYSIQTSLRGKPSSFHTTHESRLRIILQHSRIIITSSSPWLVLST